MHSKSYHLTKHPVGSLAEMWTIAWPLILGLLSSSLMMFVDRFLLAQYSIDALTASANAGTATFTILVGPMTVAGISEVFVGQYHGHLKPFRMGEFTWQMLWFSIFLSPIFFAIAKGSPQWIFYGTGNEEKESLYFSVMIYFGSVFTAVPALMGYFAGQGKVKIITIGAILCNVLNIFFDVVFIFGWNGIPSMGVLGAALATVLATVIEVVFFLILFFSKKGRKVNGTANFGFRYPDFIRCIKVGLPAGIAHISEMVVHMAFFRLMIFAGPKYLIIASIVQSFYLLINFLVEGLSKAVIAISSNLIGASIYKPLKRVLFSAIRLQFIFATIVGLMFFMFPDRLLQLMITSDDRDLLNNSEFVGLFYRTIFWLGCYFFFEGIVWSLIGLLTAAGDTRFIMIIGIVIQWAFYFTPLWIAIRYLKLGVDKAWMLIVINSIILMITYAIRVQHERWKVIKI